MADPKPHIFDGTKWLPLQGADGAEGPTVVSADAKNLAKIGTDGKLLVSQPDLDAIYVNLAGDTMTGPLAVTPSAALTSPAGHIQISGQGFQPAVAIQGRGDANGTGTPQVRFFRTRGTVAAPSSVQANDNLGTIAYYGLLPNGTVANPASIIVACDVTPAAGDTTAKGRITLNTSTFACTATNFTVDSAGSVVSANGNFSVNNSGFITSKDGILVQRARLGTAGQFETSNVGSGETGYGIQAKCTGTSLTSGSVAGVLGQVTGTASTGIGVAATVTATATQNFGLRSTVSGGTRNIGLYVDVPKADGSYAVQFQGDADSYFKSNVGIGWSTPTVLLEVGGATKLRSTLEVVGNITSTGTAHNFAAKSIPASAINGVPAAASTAPLDLSSVAAAGSATTYARADHQHKLPTYSALGPLPLAAIGQAGAVKAGTGLTLAVDGTLSVASASLKLDDLTDVAVTTPTFGQVIQYNGTNWVNQPLITNNPGIQAPVLENAWDINSTTGNGALGSNRPILVLNTPPTASATLLGVHHRFRTKLDVQYGGTFAVTTLGKFNTATGIFTGGVALYSDWVSMTLGPNEKHAVLGPAEGSGVTNFVYSIRYYSATENGVWSNDRVGDAFTPSTPTPVNNSTNFYQASRTIGASDVGRDIANNSTNSTAVVFTLPADSVCPVGTQIKVFDCSLSATTTIQCPVGQTMRWNSSLTGGSNGDAGGAGPQTLSPPANNFKLTLLKVAANTWFVFE
jgi:hypothetical protein